MTLTKRRSRGLLGDGGGGGGGWPPPLPGCGPSGPEVSGCVVAGASEFVGS